MPSAASQRKPVDWIEFVGEVTDHVANAHIGEVVIWCSETQVEISHWITSFLFPTTPDRFHGISFKMYIPKHHKHNNERTNSLGSLKITTFNTSSSPVTRTPRVKFTTQFRVPNVTVLSLLQEVQRRGLQFYRFNEFGCGCLRWSFELLKMLMEFGWVNSHSEQRLENQIEDWRNQNKHLRNRIPMPPCQGDFVDGPLSRTVPPPNPTGEGHDHPRPLQEDGPPAPDLQQEEGIPIAGTVPAPSQGGTPPRHDRSNLP